LRKGIGFLYGTHLSNLYINLCCLFLDRVF
jgi:hypothetical protein